MDKGYTPDKQKRRPDGGKPSPVQPYNNPARKNYRPQGR